MQELTATAATTGSDAGGFRTMDSVVAVYGSHESAERAVRALERSGFDMRRLSIVGRGYHTDEQVVGYYNTGDRVRYWGKLGAFWGALSGILFGSAMLFVPVFGHIVILGPLVSALANGVVGSAITGGVSALGAALYGVGIPKNSVVQYEAAVHADRYLLVAHGSADEVRLARESLAGTGAERLELHAGARLDDA